MFIKCINKDVGESLTLNEVYLVIDESLHYYKIINDENKPYCYTKQWFTPLDEQVEKVEHPSHYNEGIEAIKYINSWSMDFLEGNIIKYVTRYKYKNGIEDLKKAKQYLDWLIEREDNKNG